MSNRTHSAEQIAEALRLLKSGRSVKEVSSGLGVTTQTIYRWKHEYEDLDATGIKRRLTRKRLRGRSGANPLSLFPVPPAIIQEVQNDRDEQTR